MYNKYIYSRFKLDFENLFFFFLNCGLRLFGPTVFDFILKLLT